MEDWTIHPCSGVVIILNLQVFQQDIFFFSTEGRAALPMTSGGRLSEPVMLTVNMTLRRSLEFHCFDPLT